MGNAQALLILLTAGCAQSLAALASVTARSDFGPGQRLVIMTSGVAALCIVPLMVVTARPVWMLPLVLVICLLLTTPGAPRQRGLLAVAAVTGRLLAYLAQFKGFDYHRMAPVVWSLGLVVSLALPLNFKKMMVAIAVAALAFLPMPQAVRGALGPPVDQPMLRAALPPPDPQVEPQLGLHSLWLKRSFPMVNATDMRWPSRYPSLWYLTGSMRALNTPGRSEEVLRAATATMSLLRRHRTEDLAPHKLQYVLVDTMDTSGWPRDPDFDLPAFLPDNEAFAREW